MRGLARKCATGEALGVDGVVEVEVADVADVLDVIERKGDDAAGKVEEIEVYGTVSHEVERAR